MKEDKKLSKKEQFKFLENKHGKGNVYIIEIEDKYCFLKNPDRAIYGRALASMTPIAGVSQADPLKAGTHLLIGCWLEGDNEIKTDDAYLIPASTQALSLMQVKEASIKKKL